jgi:hypothetical protein
MYQWSPCASGAAYVMAIDWQNDGSFANTGDNITVDLLDQGITVDYGRDQDRQLSPAAVGRAAFALCNASRVYSPENTASPLAGDIGAARPVQFTASFQGTPYSLFTGRLDDFEVRADRSARNVSFTALDGLALLQSTDLSTALYQGMRTGDLINVILDTVGWTGGRDIDPGATTVPWWWSESNGFDAVQELVQSEGPPAIAYVDPNNTFVFRDRHHRILDTVSLTSQATFAASRALCDSPAVTGFSYTEPFVYQHGWKDIVNSVTFSVDQRVPDPQLSYVWTSEDTTYTVQSGQTITIDVQTTEPFMDATSINMDINDPAPTMTAYVNRLSGQSLRLTLRASGGTAVITAIRLLGRSIPVARTVKVMAEDTVSIGQHGRKEYPNTAPWASTEDAKAVANVILAHYAQRRPTVKIRVTAQDPAHLVQMLSRRPSDRITIRNDEMGLLADFHIESVSHTVQRINPDKGPVHAVVFGCERALAGNTSNPFTFDKAGAGFNDGFFGVQGIDDPSTVFIFDHPTQGKFGTGLFGT